MQICLVATSVKYYTKFVTSDTHTVLLKLHAKLAPGWALIRVNFDPVQEIGRKVGGGRSFVSGPFFARLRYSHSPTVGPMYASRYQLTQAQLH